MGPAKKLSTALPPGDVVGAAAAFDRLASGSGTAAEALAQLTGADPAGDAAVMLAALSRHARRGELDQRMVAALTADVADLFRLLTGLMRRSRLAPLLVRRHAVDAELAARGGAPWDAAWHGWLALQAAGDDDAPALLLPLGRRCLRLGQARAATEALLAAAAVDPGAAPVLVAAYRLAGDAEAALAAAKRYDAAAYPDPAARQRLAWERRCAALAGDGRLEPLYLLARGGASVEQLVSLALWARAVKGREWWERVLKSSTLRTKVKDDAPDAPGLRASVAALAAVEGCYDSGVLLDVRLAALRTALASRARLATVEHELLLLASAARALARHSQPYLAAGVIQEYRNLSLCLSQGAKDDVLGVMADLRDRGLVSLGDSPLGEAAAPAGRALAARGRTAPATRGDVVRSQSAPGAGAVVRGRTALAAAPGDLAASDEQAADSEPAGEAAGGVAPDDGGGVEPTPTGAVRRAGIMAKAAAGMALTMAGAKARLLVAAEGEKRRIREREAEALAATLHAALGRLRGVATKLGQTLSIAAADLPPAIRDMLGLLTEQATPMPLGSVRAVVEAGLGAPIEALFAAWSDAPLAAGSIGQVHRARLADGRAVAVKVQYPGIRAAIEADLANARLALRLLAWRFPSARLGEMLDEVRALLVAECDYAAELANLTQMRALFADDAALVIPAPVAERSCATVLTMELVDGESFDAFARSAPQADRDRIGASIGRFMYESIFRHGIVYGDPQPGNFKVTADGRLAVLDFGCVRRWPDLTRTRFADVYRAVLEDRRPAFDAAVRALGCVVDDARFDFAGEWRNVETLMLRPFLVPGPFRYTGAFVSAVAHQTVTASANRHAGTVPAELVITGRLSFGLNHVLALLEAAWPWRELLLPTLYAGREQWPPPREPPSPSLEGPQA